VRRRVSKQARRVAAVGCLAGFVTVAHGAEEDLYFSSLPVVATVSRLPQKLSEAPGAVTVIDQAMIRSSGMRNIADLLRLVPGFQVTMPNQESSVVAYHGLSNEEYTPRVQVLIDGRSLYSPLFKSGVNWNLLPVAMEDIERIEVIRGSNSVSYGSNAFLGVVNIITQHASQAAGWLVAANHGSQAVRDETLRWGGKVGGADVRFTYHQLGDSGLRKMYDGSLGWFDPHDSRHSQVLDLRADIPLTDRDELQVSLSQAHDVSQFGRPFSLSDPFRDLSQSSSAINAEWRRAVAPGEELKLRFAHVEDWMSGNYPEQVSYQTPAARTVTYSSFNNQEGKSVTDELEFQHTLSPAVGTRLVWGATAKNIALSSAYQFATTDWRRRSSYRAFANLEWRPATEWVFNAGSSIEHDSIAGWISDPRLSASYHVLPGQTLRFIVSRSHRTPSLYEALGMTNKTPVGAASPVDRTYLAIPGLQAERIDTVEVGYLGEFPSIKASLDIRGFHERIPNRIQIVPYALSAAYADSRDTNKDRFSLLDASKYPYGRADAALNLEHALIQGYEYQWRWQPLENTRILYNHAYTKIYADLTNANVVADRTDGNVEKIPAQTRDSAPRHSTSAMLVQGLPQGFEASVMYFKSGYLRWLRNSYTDPYERVDWRLAKTFRIGSTRGEVAFTSQIANHFQEGRRNTRIANEMHWLSLRLEY